MNEINCPHCEKAFKVDQAGYADIIKQVRNHVNIGLEFVTTIV
jgi:hypothetical protein